MHWTYSKNGVAIRLSAERWGHISQNHPEMAEHFSDVLSCVMSPDEIRSGRRGENLAIRKISKDKVLVVVYRESDSFEGFVITAFLTRRLKWLQKRKTIWP